MRSDLRLGFISSYVPKKCGIATFSRDLMDGMLDKNPNISLYIAAAEKDDEHFDYDNRVVTRLKTSDRNSYKQAATSFNKLNLNAVMLQHEFGLFGGARSKFVYDGVKHDDPTGDWI